MLLVLKNTPGCYFSCLEQHADFSLAYFSVNLELGSDGCISYILPGFSELDASVSFQTQLGMVLTDLDLMWTSLIGYVSSSEA